MAAPEVGPLGTTNTLYTPVEFETCDSLCGCELTNGKGLLAWNDSDGTSGAANLRFAITDSPLDWLSNDVVESGDASTISGNTSGFEGTYGSSCWVGNDGLPYVYWVYSRSSQGVQVLHQGNAAEPTSFSIHVNLRVHSPNVAGLLNFGAGQRNPGIPIVDGDDWVLPSPYIIQNSALNVAYCHGSIWRSTDGGSSWSLAIEAGNRTMNRMSGNIGIDPATGYWYWGLAENNNDRDIWYESTDSGASWTQIQTIVSNPEDLRYPYTNDSGGLYALYREDGSGTAQTALLNDPGNDATDLTQHRTHAAFNAQARIVKTSVGTFLFSEDTVQGFTSTTTGPFVGRIRLG